ncbi:putative ribonuclease h protein, partial [Nicotiana attenuata]
YLGYPILHNQPTHKDFQYIIDNMHRKLSSWKAKFLNIAGRAALAISTLNSIPSHAMHYTYLPAKTLKEIDRIQRNFICGSTTESRKIHYVNWSNVITTKEQGGLGLQSAKNKNLISLSSLAWRAMTNASALWSKMLIHRYANNKPVINTSFIWKSIIKGRSFCSKGITWHPCKNSLLSVWHSNWIP